MDKILIVKEDEKKTVLLTKGRYGFCLKLNRFDMTFHGWDVDERDLNLIYECLKEWKYPETF